MKTVEVDVAILGAGTAGLNARRAAEKAGATAVMIDPGPLGTTCARVGCMPSKLLIAAADAAWHARHAGVFGVGVEGVTVDGPAVLDRVKRERDRFVGFVLEATDAHAEAGRLLHGRGRFVDPHTLRVDDHTEVRFKAAVIATGSHPFIPPPFRGLGDALMQNDDVFDLDDLPESVLVVGTGVIGLELGQALHRLGVRTTLVGIRNVIGPLSDPCVKREAARVFAEELDVRFDYALHGVERVEGGVRVRFDDRDEVYERVLVAAGRRPSLDGLNLGCTGLLSEGEGLHRVDPLTGRCGDGHIFFAGDVAGYRPLLHEAADEGSIAGENAATFPKVRAHRRRTPLAVVFTDPQIAMVGARWVDLDPEQHNWGEIDYGDQGRSRVMNVNKGLVRVYGERATGRLVGAEMFGPRVEHTGHLLAWAVQEGLTVDRALEMPFYHPVVEEGIRTALRDLQARLSFAGQMETPCEEVGPRSGEPGA
ncbi:MAG: dihydrolipoyl dehydrogenase [Alphaproteobacteria bacterium]|nr:dihydrolipoyl dehydrogenase [Alphaproteobacteria bacterium]